MPVKVHGEQTSIPFDQMPRLHEDVLAQQIGATILHPYGYALTAVEASDAQLNLKTEAETIAYIEAVSSGFERVLADPRDEARPLRRQLTRAALEGKHLVPYITTEVLSRTTEKLLRMSVMKEYEMGQRLMHQNDMVRHNQDAYSIELTNGLPVEKKISVAKAMISLTSEQRELVLRSMSGQPDTYGAIDMGIGRGMYSKRVMRAVRSFGKHYSGDADLLWSQLNQAYPDIPKRGRHSIIDDIADHVKDIDVELTILQDQVDTKDFERLLDSFSQVNIQSVSIHALLQYLNSYHRPVSATPRTAQKMRDYVVWKYKKQSMEAVIDACRVTPKKILRRESSKHNWPLPLAYELTDEVQAFLMNIGVEETLPLMSQEREVALAKEVELGMWAEMRLGFQDPEQHDQIVDHLRQRGYDDDTIAKLTPLYGEALEDLRSIITAGRDAFKIMIKSNDRLAWQVGQRFLRLSPIPRSNQEITEISHRGTVRAIRKFDYKLERRFSGYAFRWMQHFVMRVAATDLGISKYDYAMAIRVRRVYDELSHELSHQITHYDVAKRMQADPSEVVYWYNRLIPETHLQGQELLESDIMTTTASPSEFSSDAKILIQSALKGDVALCRIADMRFAQDYTEEEIAGALDMAVDDVHESMQQILNALRASCTQEELLSLLSN